MHALRAFGVWRLAFGVWRLAFGVWRLAFGVWRLAFGVSNERQTPNFQRQTSNGLRNASRGPCFRQFRQQGAEPGDDLGLCIREVTSFRWVDFVIVEL